MRWIIIILAGVFTAGNALEAKPDNIIVPAMKGPSLNVSTIPGSESKLSLHFAIKNTLKHDIYVFTPILTYDRQKKKRLPDPARVYVSWQTGQNKEAIRLSRQLWPIPDRLEVYAPEVPHLTRLSPGESLQENLSIDLPLKIDYPYMSAFSKKKRHSLIVKTPVNAIIFAMGYVSGEPKALRLEATADGTFTIPYGIGITHQNLVERKLYVNVSVVE